MSDRLRLAVENGHVALPEGRLLVLNAPRDIDVAGLDKEDSVLWTRSAADRARLAAAGWNVAAPAGGFAGAIVVLPRARQAQKASLRMAAEATSGPVIVDGAKTDGVDAFYKEARKHAEVSPAYSKAHGKVFTLSTLDADDWPKMDIEPGADGWWRGPGVFSADGVDKASAFLADHLPEALSGSVADLGSGWGYLAKAVLQREGVRELHLVEDDALADRAARRNVEDARARFHHADALTWKPPAPVDHVVTNPPFHTGRAADPSLGQAFIRAAAGMLTPKGSLWLVANRQLPYESTLEGAFRTVRPVAETSSFKVFTASQPRSPRKG